MEPDTFDIDDDQDPLSDDALPADGAEDTIQAIGDQRPSHEDWLRQAH